MAEQSALYQEQSPKKSAPVRSVEPIGLNKLTNMEHAARFFNVILPESIRKEDLERPEIWVNVGSKLAETSEIRVVAQDMSFVAYLFVTYALGSTVRVKVLSIHEWENTEDLEDESLQRYAVKRRGLKKWCIIDNVDGRVMYENIVTKQQAMSDREDLLKALSR